MKLNKSAEHKGLIDYITVPLTEESHRDNRIRLCKEIITENFKDRSPNY